MFRRDKNHMYHSAFGDGYAYRREIFLIYADVDCGNLNDPANGSVNHTSGTTFGQTATYSCNTGYNLVGDSIRTCQATGVWSGSAPTCESMLLKDDLSVYSMHMHNKNITINSGYKYPSITSTQ